MNFRKGTINDLDQIIKLGVKSWAQYKEDLKDEHWSELYRILNSSDNYTELLEVSRCLICEDDHNQLIGMAFLVPNGNPTEIYDEAWCHLRFVSVDPEYRGLGIGEALTRKCIEIALGNNEQIMALHTAEIMGPAQRIYEKIGFKRFTELPPALGVRYWLYLLDLSDYKSQQPTIPVNL